MIASCVVLPLILISRARIKRSRGSRTDRIYGEFTILGEEGHGSPEEGFQNGIRGNRVPTSHYVRLGEPGELQTFNLQRSPSGNVM
jgi:hypothetical protein